MLRDLANLGKGRSLVCCQTRYGKRLLERELANQWYYENLRACWVFCTALLCDDYVHTMDM